MARGVQHGPKTCTRFRNFGQDSGFQNPSQVWDSRDLGCEMLDTLQTVSKVYKIPLIIPSEKECFELQDEAGRSIDII